MAEKFQEKYFDVLQNIETGIVWVYNNHPELTDWDVQNGLDALIRTYQSETRKRPAPAVKLEPLAQETYDAARKMCETRLGRNDIPVIGPDD